MRWKVLLLAISAALLATGCPAQVECDPECSWWQTCLEGECIAAPGHCDGHEDCDGSRPVCHLTDRVCVEEGDPCALCEEWQECGEDGECRPRPGRCGDSGDCPPEAPACNSETNRCVEASRPYFVTSWAGVIITTGELAPAFERLAGIHTLTGAPARVVTVEEICDPPCSTTDPRDDAPARIKAWLSEQQGLRYVLLGGGQEEVPSRFVTAAYANSLMGVSFEEEFVTDFYYADLSEWDKNGNGIYAEPEDHPDAGETGVLDYMADLAVARLPVSSVEEVERYTGKVTEYLLGKDLSRVRDALLISNVATTFDVMGSAVDIDGGLYFDLPGRTIDIFPADTSFVKLFALGPTEDSPDALTLTVDLQREEMEKGPNLIVHAGHGSEWYLTAEEGGGNGFTGDLAYGLGNTELPIMLSCACHAGNFAYAQGAAAGEKLINAPAGGAIGYMGNTTIGLGLGGGSQIIDEFLRCSFASPNPRVGDCLLEAHHEFSYPDEIELPFVGSVTVVDRDSWRWTKKSVVYFGDPMLPIVTDPATAPPPMVTVSRSSSDELSELLFSVDPPVAGILMVRSGDELYRTEVEAEGRTSLTVVGEPSAVQIGFVADGAMPFHGEHDF